VVVKDRMVLAVEAIEGTDEAIKRAVLLARGPVVVVKVAKLGQDQRFDTPTVGMNTMQAMTAEKPGGVLAIEKTMVVEREEMVAYADQHDISIVGV
jgi:UDP-2,3-diacylglucosamine hydrolase